MEGKLFKMAEGYTLSLTGSIDDLYGISDKQLAEDHQLQKLSLKNCEAIENDYDLDELTNRAFDNMGYHSTVTPHEEKQFKLGYRVAFREALEILGDKKFSEEDIYNALDFARGNGKYRYEIMSDDDFIQSLQQTEFDVEIEMEYQGFEEDGKLKEAYLPKLDADGCLILKRK